ncbi:hypothetical protein LNQ82_01405 [Conchiformibius steedae DSM 2580]|uniref:Uncharacterized protein n=1 Tax=Conchiformibius steedae DSM 2580 TaxID=1121352 RepID=A0AAE9HUI4_9NEIS|nr:hypothetical protein [Conchiformibius steedae]URD67849.1 hypothetical protein LNQ82_01405 [Conchiformibius steedae DSM 2580]
MGTLDFGFGGKSLGSSRGNRRRFAILAQIAAVLRVLGTNSLLLPWFPEYADSVKIFVLFYPK